MSSALPSRRLGALPPGSLKLIRYFGNAGLAAGFLLRSSHRGSAQANRADGFVAEFDGNAALQGNDVGEHSLALNIGFRALRPLGGCAPEGQRRIGLAASQFDIVR